MSVLLSKGISVVLDFPANTRAQRAWFRGILERSKAEHELHFVDASDALCKSQLRQRSSRLPPGTPWTREADFEKAHACGEGEGCALDVDWSKMLGSMSHDSEVATHYTRGNLLARLNAALADDGVDPQRPSIEALAPYDQFHGRGLEATLEVAELMQAGPGDRLLDIGSGIGGPARYFARRFGCRVTGIDLTAEFCEVARHLTRLLGMQDKVRFETGNALSMPFADASFDGAYSMNVSMNIADKAGLYREIARVLKPGAWLVLSELAKGEGGELDFPTPWAASARTSFLASPEATRRGLGEAGFEVVRLHDTLAQSREFGARSRAMVERGEKPPHRAVMLIHGEIAGEAAANTSRGLSEGRIVPIEILARRLP